MHHIVGVIKGQMIDLKWSGSNYKPYIADIYRAIDLIFGILIKHDRPGGIGIMLYLNAQ